MKRSFTEVSENVEAFVTVLKSKHDNEKVISFLCGMITSLVVLMLTADPKNQKKLLENVLNIK